MPAGRPRNDRQMDHCRELGVSCRECVECTARNLVAITPDATSGQVRQMFNAMYPNANCQPMANTFLQAFHQGKPSSARKPVRSERLFDPAPVLAVA